MLDDHNRLRQLREAPPREIPVAYRMQRFVEAMQVRICKALERFEPEARFLPDRWEREGGGGGITRVLEGGRVFEKAGVNTSAVHGTLPDRMARLLRTPSRRRITAVSVFTATQRKSWRKPARCAASVHHRFRSAAAATM